MSGLSCPVCQSSFREVLREGILIDVCTQCRGVWLDRGELEKLIELARDDRAEQAPPPPQAPRPQTYEQPPQYARAPQGYRRDDDDDDDDRKRYGYGQHDHKNQYGYKKKKRGFDFLDIFGD